MALTRKELEQRVAILREATDYDYPFARKQALELLMREALERAEAELVAHTTLAAQDMDELEFSNDGEVKP